jgi:ADP-ribose pyrophosphatase
MSTLTSLAKGRFLELVSDAGWEFVRRTKGATPVGIAAMTSDSPPKVILISQHRRPVGKICIEIPAGLVGDSDAHAQEDWQSAARRELEEETGYTADSFSLLAEGPTSAGLTDECIKLVRAHGVRKIGNPTPDGDEQITVHALPLAAVPAFLAQQQAAGHLIDPKVFAALYFLTSPARP